MTLGWRITLNTILFVLLITVASASWLLRTSAANTNYEFLPNMAHSARYGAYSQNPNFADGKTLHAPPSGAIARGHMPLHYTAIQADALRAGEELVNPFGSGTENSIQRGAKVFTNYCAVCHGSDALGLGPVAQRGFPPPPSLLLPHTLQMKDGQMFHVLTYGQNNMPSYASQVTPEDRWNVITYIRSIQSAAQKKLAVAGRATTSSAGGH
jgi:mono/diheme cytochrome c family protein